VRVATRVEPVNQAIVVTIQVPVLRVALTLRSDWTAARLAAHRWEIDGVAPGDAVEVTVVGRAQRVTAGDDGRARFQWDGRDAAGTLVGEAIARATVSGVARAARLGRFPTTSWGLGGLLLDGCDHLDAERARVHTGTGRIRRRVARRRVGEDLTVVSMASGRELAHFDRAGYLTRVVDRTSGTVRQSVERGPEGLVSMRRDRARLDVVRGDDSVRLGTAAWYLTLGLDGDGRVVSCTDPSGRSVAIGYGAGGLVERVVDASGHRTTVGHDEAGRLVEVTYPGRGPVSLIRTAIDHGHRVAVLTAEGRESSFSIQRWPDGSTVRTSTCCGGATTVTTIRDDVIETRRPDGSVGRFGRRAGERTVTLPSGLGYHRRDVGGATTINGVTETVVRDGDTEVLTTGAGRRLVHRSVPGASRLDRPDGHVEWIEDQHGQVARIVTADDAVDVSRDATGLPVGLRWADGRVTTFERDRSGWLTAQRFSDGRVVRLERGGSGEVTSVTPPGAGPTRLVHDAPGRVASVTFPAPEGVVDRTDIGFDGDGLIVSVEVSGSPVARFHRGASGAVEAIEADHAAASFRHEFGRRTAGATGEGQTTSVVHDGPLVTEIREQGLVDGLLGYAYDAWLRPAEIGSGDLRGSLRYDDDGRLSSVGPARIERDAAGRLRAIRSGVVEQTFAIDERGRTVAMQVTVAGRPVWTTAYAHDAMGRIVRIEDSDEPEPSSFRYDTAGRLVEVAGPVPSRTDFDDNGNPTRFTRGERTSPTVIVEGDRLVRIGDREIGLGPRGRIERVGQEIAFAWDGLQRVRRVTVRSADGATRGTTVRRGAMGQLVAVEPSDGPALRVVSGRSGRPELVVDEDGAPRSLLVGATRDRTPLVAMEAGRALFLASDHVGSVRLVIDCATGEIVGRRRYDPWGITVHREGDAVVPYGFAGGIDDPIAPVVHFPARTYVPHLQRWASRDPLLFGGGSANPFSYVDGDPVNRVDPTGRQVWLCRQTIDFIPGVEGEQHWWIKTSETEAGVALDPRQEGGKWGIDFPTAMGDHAGRSEQENVVCDPVDDVDEACVDNLIGLGADGFGTDTGWYGPTNHCQTAVDDILSGCAADGEYTVRTDEPDSYDNWYSPDVNTAPRGDDGGGSGAGDDAGGGGDGSGGAHPPVDQTPGPDHTPDPGYTPAPDHTPDPGYTADPGQSSIDDGELWE